MDTVSQWKARENLDNIWSLFLAALSVHYSINYILAYIGIMQLNLVECFAFAKEMALLPLAVSEQLKQHCRKDSPVLKMMCHLD